MSSARLQRVAATVLLSLGLGILLVAYVVVCLRAGSAFPWNEVVHEDGQRTLRDTILYFEHAARELPIDIVLGIAIGGCLLFVCPPARHPAGPRNADGSRASRYALASAAVVVIIVAGTAIVEGWPVLWDNLMQHHTRPGAPLVWGSHWRYHLLSRLALMLGMVGLAGLLRLLIGRDDGAQARRGLAVVAGSLALFAALTAVFAQNPGAMLLPFVDPVYLGHQAREVFTHLLATVPIAWGVCLLLARPGSAAPPAWPARLYAWPVTAAAGASGALLGAYLGIAALLADSASHGQTEDLLMLILPHFFEHGFTYVVVTVVALLVYETAALRPAAASAAT